MGTAAADRLTHFDIKVDADEWLEWAEAKGLHPYVLAYIKAHTEKLHEEEVREKQVRTSPRSWAVISDYLYAAEQEGLSQVEEGSDLQMLLEGRIGQEHTADFIQKMKEIKQLYPVEEYLKAVRDTKNPKRLLQMAPTQATPNYGLMFSLASYCDSCESLVDAMYIFKRFRELDDDVNREEMYTSAITILGGKLMKMDGFYQVIKNPTFSKQIAPDIVNIPSLSDLAQEFDLQAA